MKTVMIVDDDYDIRKSVAQVLEKNDYNVTFAVSGDDCLEKLKTENPDLILMDIKMPGTPVRSIVRQINKIKIMYLSVVPVSDAEKMGLLTQKNVMGFISKPFNVDDLVRVVRETIG
jgi:DNA-binding NtrC family response regulator